MARPRNQSEEKNFLVVDTDEELANMTREEVIAPLNDKQRRFCEEYVRNFNATLAAKKAGYNNKAAHVLGWKLRQNPDVSTYIAWLKMNISKKLHVNAMTIIDQYLKIAFADVTDVVKVKNGKLTVSDTSEIDGTIVTEVKQGKDGITIKLADKMKALDKLEKYFNIMPKDWREKVEYRKLELMEQKLELEKLKAGQVDNEDEDDGFIEALKGTVPEVWDE